MVVLNWIIKLLIRLLIVPVDVVLRRRKKIYRASTVIHAPTDAIWAHLTAERLKYDGVMPYEISQVRRANAPDILDAEIRIGDTKMTMVLRELENDGSTRLVSQVLRDGTDPALYLGDNYIIATEISEGPDDESVTLSVAYAIEHRSIGGRFSLPLSLDDTLRRIKGHVEKEQGTADLAPRGTPMRDAMLTGLITLGSFAILFDLSLALQLVFILLLHELGHVIAMRWVGMPVKGVYFIPFMGAVAVGQRGFDTESRRGFIALMGPAASMLTTLVFMYLFMTSGDGIWRDLALVSIILNGFNLLPVLPLDGGQILSALMSRAPFVAQRVVQLSLLAVVAVFAVRFQLYVTLTFVGIIALFLAMQKPSPLRLQPLGLRAGVPLVFAYLATFAFYIGAGLWLVQLGRG